MQPLTNQQFFDNALFGIRAQGYVPSQIQHPVDSEKPGTKCAKCAYRGIMGRKCAIGFSIPDELYSPKIDDGDGMSVDSLARNPEYPELNNLFSKANKELLERMQCLHDHLQYLAAEERPKTFEKGMAVLAKEFGLKYARP